MLGCLCWEENHDVQSHEFPRGNHRHGGRILPWGSLGFKEVSLPFDAAENPLTRLTQPQTEQLGKRAEAGGQEGKFLVQSHKHVL